MRKRWIGAVSACVVWLCATACGLLGGGAPQPTGTAYSVTETLATDTCGAQSDQVQAVSQFSAHVAVNAMTGLATWSVGSNGGPATGGYDGQTHVGSPGTELEFAL